METCQGQATVIRWFKPLQQFLCFCKNVVRMEETVAEFGEYLLQLFLMCTYKELTAGKFNLVIFTLIRIQSLEKPWKDCHQFQMARVWESWMTIY